MTKSLPAWAMVVLTGLWGCGRVVDGPSEPPINGQGGGAPVSDDAGPGAMMCSPVAPKSPLRRLTTFEYSNTVRDLLGDTGSRPRDVLLADESTNDADMMQVTSLLVDGYHTLAHETALRLTSDPTKTNALTGCDPAVAGEDACKKKLLEEFVPKMLRRAYDPVDTAAFEEVFATGQKLGGDFASGVRAVLEVGLQSPEFLYRVELGEPKAMDAPPRPSPHEMAARLSYLLWGSAPDQALRDAAAQDKLRTKEDIAAQARRLLADNRAHDVVRYFYLQWLQLGDSRLLQHPFPMNGSIPSDIADLFMEETKHFLDDVTWQAPGDFRSLLTAPFTWTNDRLAKFYGYTAVTGDAFQRIPVPADRRGGILTQGSFLASHAHETTTSPVHRGIWVMQHVLCTPPPPPPPDIAAPIPPDFSPNATMRERLSVATAPPQCQGCHREINALGFAFENYDGTGLWRDTENGVRIDATGEIFQTDAKGKFNGAIELAHKLADSRDVQNCFVGEWMTFAYGRKETPEDACSRRLVEDAFVKSKGNVIELIVALTQTDAFLYRSPSE